MEKERVIEECFYVIDQKLNTVKQTLEDLKKDIQSESKSTAGDKHETGRAMIHLEQEKLSNQLKQLSSMKYRLEKISETDNRFNNVTEGALIRINNGWMFLSVALGKVQVDLEEVMVISGQSPIGGRLMGRRLKDIVEINGTRHIIEEIH